VWEIGNVGEEIVEAIVCFLFGFCFRRSVEVVIVGGKTNEQEFRFSKKFRRQVLVRLLEGGKGKERSVRA
jgi:hypothetical protein